MIEVKKQKVNLVMRAAKMSRQAYYANKHSVDKQIISAELLCEKVLELRSCNKRLGVRKMLPALMVFTQQMGIKIGRDSIFKILDDNGLLIKSKRRNRPITTMSKHRFRKYPNIIKGMVPTKANQVWVSDITYVTLGRSFCYLSLITDMYSRKIVGYNLHKDLKAAGTIDALKLAIKNVGAQKLNGLIHHSDRGFQYCCNEYVKLLKDNGIRISMTENGDPLENAIAERVNGIVKQEYALETCSTYSQLQNRLTAAIFHYNNERTHMSINNLTPSMAHTMEGHIDRQWHNRIFTNATTT